MAKLSLNKSSLTRQNKQLKAFQAVLPSLDLKRRQLVAEQAKARQALVQAQHQLVGIEPMITRELPMLANQQVDLTDLVKVTGVELVEENVVGTRLPLLKEMQVQVKPYPLLGQPHWIDRLVEHLKTAMEMQIQVQVAERRLQVLDKAVRTITQRVNLFDKVLIPRARSNIKKIQIYLSDVERAAVVNSKLAKQKKRVVS